MSTLTTIGVSSSKKGGPSGTTVAQVDSSSDGNAGVVSPRQQPIQQSNQSSSHHTYQQHSQNLLVPPTGLTQPHTIQIHTTSGGNAGQGRLLEEKSDRISKEKQKFFRSSAFNADHNKLMMRRGGVGGGGGGSSASGVGNSGVVASGGGGGNSNVSCTDNKSKSSSSSLTSTTAAISPRSSRTASSTISSPNRQQQRSQQKSSREPQKSPSSNRRVPPIPSPSSASSDTSSSSDDSDTTDNSNSSSSSSDEEANTSSDSSDSSSSSESADEVPGESTKSTGPFSCDANEDSPWGFAAAAAKLTTETPFFSNITSTFGAPLPKLDLGDKPTFGLHIQPAASPDTNAKASKKRRRKSANNNNNNNNMNRVRPGAGQLKGLFDGLSHFFSAPSNSRARSGGQAPNYAPDRRKRSGLDDGGGNNNENKPPKIARLEDDVSSSLPGRTKERRRKEDVPAKDVKEGKITGDCLDDRLSFEKPVTRMTPSNLVKTAVNSKRHEHERRRKGDSGSAVKCAESTAVKGTNTSGSGNETNFGTRQLGSQQLSRKRNHQANAPDDAARNTRNLESSKIILNYPDNDHRHKNSQHCDKVNDTGQSHNHNSHRHHQHHRHHHRHRHRSTSPSRTVTSHESNGNTKTLISNCPGKSSSQPRACTSATTTNTTTTPRATPCSNRKGKSLPRTRSKKKERKNFWKFLSSNHPTWAR